jgi:photosynthetic reaction center cytochrome c subunit
MNRFSLGLWATLLGTAALLSGCERPNGMTAAQQGWRGTGMAQISNPRVVQPVIDSQPLPEPIPAIPSPEGSPLAKDTYKNVQVLGDVPAPEFTRTMLAITAWVAPKQGCAYCHAAGEELSSDKLYTKVVARKMLQMTRHINTDWQQHVSTTGVTCYTCHRGNPVPSKIWFTQPELKNAGSGLVAMLGQNHPSALAGNTSLGLDPLTPYLLGDTQIRQASTTALPASLRKDGVTGIKQTEGTFGLMVHMSTSLGVNCTTCHNTRSHAEWAESPPQRTTAWYGIRMARDLNNAYLVPLTSTFPAERLGPTGDVAKVSCATCHQGLNKPLKGAPLLKDHPVLGGAMKMAAAAPAAAAVPDSAVVPAAAASR